MRPTRCQLRYCRSVYSKVPFVDMFHKKSICKRMDSILRYVKWQLWGSNPRPCGLAPEASALDHSAKLSLATARTGFFCWKHAAKHNEDDAWTFLCPAPAFTLYVCVAFLNHFAFSTTIVSFPPWRREKKEESWQEKKLKKEQGREERRKCS